VVCAVTYTNWKDNSDINFLSTLVAGAILTNLFQVCAEHVDYLAHTFKLIIVWIRGGSLRISFASLIRIKIENEYFLIKSKRFDNLWQPVGGVYKYFDSGLRQRFGLQDDNGKFKKSDPNELRLSLTWGKIFKAFSLMKWFDSRRGREISPDREFREEVIDTGILDKNIFKEVHFEFIERTFEMRFSDKFQVWELMAFEVFELKLTEPQKEGIKKIISEKNGNVVSISKRDIDHSGFSDDGTDYRLGSQTKYIL
jgi:hypothetical protein